MDVKPGRIVMTGAAGRIGSVLRAGLRADAEHLVLLDREPVEPEGDRESAARIDIGDRAALVEAFTGADAVLHLAAIPDEAPLDDLLDVNVRGTHNVLEAARRAGVPRVVLFSSNRVTGNYPIHHHVFPDEPPRPDGLYGVSKVAAEALGQLYADTFGLEVVALRVGSFAEEPTQTRHLATWLSPRDCVGFARAALTAPNVAFVAAYAVSGNARRFWDLSAGENELGYRPVDDAARFAGRFGDDDPFWHGGPQGGAFARPESVLPHLRE
ncbi:NAD-dependent epimerase/dehydratase family protein [Streptomonospora nanhaiensis]|uniref:NAD-dependent epimerase/dehydratase family protein n=1 Tax=Streptomonospora nanhaiensis TaxID=1323731 RepID=UPI001C38AE93|nr:NAD(P)-dependent oxidoreductase [Streptomonospora nanhaiensis]MBV2367029.1 NAD(P)-dependent oxidoreductase [Streptomonospora nanhaiensis]MBX9389309.1 NAD(P)-dependent oxidoreductase [Streptomonospora nanhaiensis]